jgi:hypothetical protein
LSESIAIQSRIVLSSTNQFHQNHPHRKSGYMSQRCHPSRAIAVAQLLADSWGQDIPAPQSILSTMVSIPISTNLDRESLHNLLWQKYQIEVPIIPFYIRLCLRISAQIYNQLSEYEYLADSFLQTC